MGYDIYIGNAVSTSISDYDGEYEAAWKGITVKRVVVDDAPNFPGDGMTGKSNRRHPGYSQWSDFCWDSGLINLFFDKETGLMRSHPGTFKLTAEHLLEVQDVLKAYKERNPDAVPGWGYVEGRELDGTLARLIWLEFWFSWALLNCERPAIHNH